MNRILEELLDEDGGIGVCWLGNLSWLLRSDGKLIATDLDLDRDSRLFPSPIPTQDLAEHLDVLFITHEHGDHFAESTARILSEHSGCRFVLPESCLSRAQAFGIDSARITVAIPDHRPQGEPTLVPLEVEGIRVEPVRAFHGHTDFTVYRRASIEDCGYVFTLDGKRVYQPGDSVLLQQHMEDYADVDVLFVSPTLHNTHIDATVRMIEAIQPSFIFPQHFGTYQPTDQNSYWTVGCPDEVRAALSEPLRSKFHILEQGVVFRI
jgi:L-ascorbate metabolism protein UlaG (beta-lactamase superfamily)